MFNGSYNIVFIFDTDTRSKDACNSIKNRTETSSKATESNY